MALWRRDRSGRPAGPGLAHHGDAGSQYTSARFTTHLVDAGIDASTGTVGDALDNALMESAIGLYKTELIKPRWPAARELKTAVMSGLDVDPWCDARTRCVGRQNWIGTSNFEQVALGGGADRAAEGG